MSQELRVTEKAGKTVEEAISTALAELGLTREEAEIEILEEPSKGIFGLIGSRPARVRVKEKLQPDKVACQFLQEVLRAMQIAAEVKVNKENEGFYISFYGKDLGILIGRRGETLDALQYLVNLAVNRRLEEKVKIFLDVEEYRRRREETLIKLAQRLSDKVKRTKKHIVLEPMNSLERRVIHTALQNDPAVYTFSQGNEPYRKVVISPRK